MNDSKDSVIHQPLWLNLHSIWAPQGPKKKQSNLYNHHNTAPNDRASQHRDEHNPVYMIKMEHPFATVCQFLHSPMIMHERQGRNSKKILTKITPESAIFISQWSVTMMPCPASTATSIMMSCAWLIQWPHIKYTMPEPMCNILMIVQFEQELHLLSWILLNLKPYVISWEYWEIL